MEEGNILKEAARWRENSSEETEYPELERDFDSYMKVLDISPEDLKDKKILNIGSGFRGMFELEAKKRNIDVVSINPNLRNRLNGRRVGEKPVAAYAQSLPFADNSFDYILALVSIPTYLSPLDYENTHKEVLRVLKPKGVYISGNHWKNNLRSKEIFESKVISKLRNQGHDVQLIPVGGLVQDNDYFRLKITKK